MMYSPGTLPSMLSIIMPIRQEAQNVYFFPSDTVRMARAANSTLPEMPPMVKYCITHTWIR